MNKEKYYAVRVGRKTGIYTDARKSQEQVIGISGAKCRKFSTIEEAEKYMNEIDLSPSKSSSIKENINDGTQTNPSSDRKEAYYAVKVGRKPGIYTKWIDCQKQVSRFSHSQYAKVETFEKAKEFMLMGRLSNPNKKSATHRSKIGFYAVKCGFQRGVYTSWEECRKKVEGYHSAIFRKFKTRQEAEEFIRTNNKTQLNSSSTSFSISSTPTDQFWLRPTQPSSFVPYILDTSPSTVVSSNDSNGSSTSFSNERKRKVEEDSQEKKKRVRFDQDRMKVLDAAFDSIPSLKWNEFERLPLLEGKEEEKEVDSARAKKEEE